MSVRLHRLLLWVNDPAALSDWYCRTFSWQETTRDLEAGWIEIDAGGFILALHGGADLRPRHWPKIQVLVPDVAAWRERMLAEGIAVDEVSTWKEMEWAECHDPEGNVVQICKN